MVLDIDAVLSEQALVFGDRRCRHVDDFAPGVLAGWRKVGKLGAFFVGRIVVVVQVKEVLGHEGCIQAWHLPSLKYAMVTDLTYVATRR